MSEEEVKAAVQALLDKFGIQPESEPEPLQIRDAFERAPTAVER